MRIKSLNGHPLELLSVAEAAEALRLTIDDVDTLIATERLRAFRFGEQGTIVRVLRLDVTRLLEQIHGRPPEDAA